MRNYWKRIILGAIAIAALGTSLFYLVRGGVDRTREVVESSSSITIPLAFVPFRLDGQELGTFRKITLHRDNPKHVSGVDAYIKLQNAAGVERLGACILVAEEFEHINERTTFRCSSDADTAGQDLVPFGSVMAQLGDEEHAFPVLVPRATIDHFADSADVAGERARARADSIREEGMRVADSIRDAAIQRADSIRNVQLEFADSIREAELTRAESVRSEALERAEEARQAAEPPR